MAMGLLDAENKVSEVLESWRAEERDKPAPKGKVWLWYFTDVVTQENPGEFSACCRESVDETDRARMIELLKRSERWLQFRVDFFKQELKSREEWDRLWFWQRRNRTVGRPTTWWPADRLRQAANVYEGLLRKTRIWIKWIRDGFVPPSIIIRPDSCTATLPEYKVQFPTEGR